MSLSLAITAFYPFMEGSHLFTVAKVKLIMQNGNERLGYIPIYGTYRYKKDFVEGVNLKEIILTSKHTSFAFVETCYFFEGIGNMVAEEDIENIAWDSTKNIFLLSWRKDFSGSGEFDKLPYEAIQKLINQKIFHIERVEGSVCDYIYINQNPRLTANEFKLLVKYSPIEIRRDEIDYFYDLIVYPQNYKVRRGKPLPLDTALNAMLISKEYAESELKNLSQPFTNLYIRRYFLQMKSKYDKRLKIYKAIISYLKDAETKEIINFANNEIDDIETKNRILKKLNEEEDRLIMTKELLKLLFNLLSLANENKLFDEVLEKNDIILFVHSWD